MINENLPANVFDLSQSKFQAIPGNPWVYWFDDSIIRMFTSNQSLSEIAFGKHGLSTCNNFRYIRFWWEVARNNIDWNVNNVKQTESNEHIWFPLAKGFTSEKWYGNQEYVVNWGINGNELKADVKSKFPYLGDNLEFVLSSDKYYFREGLTWTKVSSTGFKIRYLPPGYIASDASMALYLNDSKPIGCLGILNSSFAALLLNSISPTINFTIGDVVTLPLPVSKPSSILENLVVSCIRLALAQLFINESHRNFISPSFGENGSQISEQQYSKIRLFETQIDNEVYKLYGLPDNIVDSLNKERNVSVLEKDSLVDDLEQDLEDSRSTILSSTQEALLTISFTIGIILGRFQPGAPGALGSAIYRRSDFAIGSLPEPTEEEFNELVGDPSQFAYIDEQGGRHVFPRQVEQALQKLALPDGIAVFNPSHPRDLPTLVSKALELMLGQAQAQEVIQQAAGGDLRKFLEKDFFTQHHIKQYRKRPVYWPIQSSKRSYGFVLFHEKIDRNTFYALQQEPYLPTKRRAVQLRLEELSKKVLTAQGAARKPIEKEMDELRQLAEELAQFAKDLDAITRGGYEPEADWIDDGVILRMAPLWSVIPLWKSEPKKYWEELAAGKYDWSRIAMKYWPERVKQVCKKNKSYAIAHGHEEWYKGG